MLRNPQVYSRIKRRSLTILALGLVLACVYVATHGGVAKRARAARNSHASVPHPNFLIIIGDDHAADTLGVNGDTHGATPRLDALARQGVNFRHAYCNAPVCTASRQSLITGRLPHAVGVTRLNTALPETAVTLGDWMLGRGYVTGAYGKMHFNAAKNHGFEDIVDTSDWKKHLAAHPPAGGDHSVPFRPFRDPSSFWLNSATRSYGLPDASMEATFFADNAAQFFNEHKKEPFTLVVGFHEPHSPFIFPDDWSKRFSPNDFPVPAVNDFDRAHQPKIFKEITPEQTRGITASYYTSISYLDSKVGRILDALEKSGLAENTIVVYLGDNGYHRGHHGRFEKHSLYERAVNVPLIMRWPGKIPAGRQIDDLVELVDILPTLMDLSDFAPPPDIQGRSLVGLIRGLPDAKGRETVFSEYLENEEAMVSDGRYKLIVGTGARHRLDGYETENPTPGPYLRLYDRKADPEENTDISGTEAAKPVIKRLQTAMFQRLTSTRKAEDQVPPTLDELEAIRWCLRPRD